MDGGGKVIDVIQDVEQLVERSEEEEIIERLKESSGGRGEFYYDVMDATCSKKVFRLRPI